MLELHAQIEAAAAAIRQRWSDTPRAGVILGTGLGNVADEIELPIAIDYSDIPHFPRSTATSHRGRLVCGRLAGVPVVAMEGRFHQYEGYPLKQITLPVRVMKALGAETLIVSQAVGGMNPYYKAGNVMVIDDHINLMGDNPLVGVNDDRLGPRFPDMSAPYTPELIEVALETARRENFVAHRGVTVAVTGPNLETRAEYRFLRQIGADVVGMSTVPEVIVARHAGIRVLGLSCIANMAAGILPQPLSHEEVMETAERVKETFLRLVKGILRELPGEGE
jgi:purine-nucleoside phosphorylase